MTFRHVHTVCVLRHTCIGIDIDRTRIIQSTLRPLRIPESRATSKFSGDVKVTFRHVYNVRMVSISSAHRRTIHTDAQPQSHYHPARRRDKQTEHKSIHIAPPSDPSLERRQSDISTRAQRICPQPYMYRYR